MKFYISSSLHLNLYHAKQLANSVNLCVSLSCVSPSQCVQSNTSILVNETQNTSFKIGMLGLTCLFYLFCILCVPQKQHGNSFIFLFQNTLFATYMMSHLSVSLTAISTLIANCRRKIKVM